MALLIFQYAFCRYSVKYFRKIYLQEFKTFPAYNVIDRILVFSPKNYAVIVCKYFKSKRIEGITVMFPNLSAKAAGIRPFSVKKKI